MSRAFKCDMCKEFFEDISIQITKPNAGGSRDVQTVELATVHPTGFEWAVLNIRANPETEDRLFEICKGCKDSLMRQAAFEILRIIDPPS